ncbi:MAG: hypothetical protein AAB642_02785 [Patescibacteria group bacterium]
MQQEPAPSLFSRKVVVIGLVIILVMAVVSYARRVSNNVSPGDQPGEGLVREENKESGSVELLGLRFEFPVSWGKFEERVFDDRDAPFDQNLRFQPAGRLITISFPSTDLRIHACSKDYAVYEGPSVCFMGRTGQLASSFQKGVDEGDNSLPEYIKTNDGVNDAMVVVEDSLVEYGEDFHIYAYFDNPKSSEFPGFVVFQKLAPVPLPSNPDVNKRFYSDIKLGKSSPEVLRKVDSFIDFVETFSY